MTARFDLESVRSQFPAFNRTVEGHPVVFLDGAAGSQVPSRVAEAVSGYLIGTNANHGGPFATSVESDAMLDAAHQAAADFLGTADPDTVAFGANMTTLTLAVSRALSSTWQPGDRILVSRLDHDANVTPWTLAAHDAGVAVDHIDIHPDTATLDLDTLHDRITDSTRLVAIGAASNLSGSINPVTEITQAAHRVGALVFVDAVHLAPHRLLNVEAWDCDLLACSAYKFFGPHVGLLWGRRNLLESLKAYKLRPASNQLPDKWMTGTGNHEGIAGVGEAIEYLADLGRDVDPTSESRRQALATAFRAIGDHERELSLGLLDGLVRLPGVTIHGITDADLIDQRVATYSITHDQLSPGELAEHLARRGIFTWAGNHYALPVTEALDLEPGGTLRISALHYNTLEEIERTISALGDVLAR
ncbi:MAG TPA: cysteine desulfurase-like protein [Planctomycetaceae bacterium]|nr:cysteine desulfurase-like protein [Planctomycetaceae bacterium]|tara:strand:- start:8814 stop:10067 length:1254 start_codon:yes stop_codon:yes gene_type:complete